MKKIYVLPLLASFLFLGKSYAQVPNNQDCLGAIPVCQSTYSNPNSYVGTGNIPNEINPSGGTCLLSGERNDVWYQFTVQSSGLLCFIIDPVTNSNDYDWAVYNLTNANCSNIATNIALEVGCDYAAQTGYTGAGPAWATAQNGNTGMLPAGTYNTGNSQINNCPNVTAGQTFVLNVSNFSSSASGYTLYFPPPGTAGMAAIYDNVPPAINSLVATPSCGATSFAFNFSENVLCNTVSTGDFTLSGPGGPYTVTGVSGPACVAGAPSENTFTITTSPAITTSGTYSLCLVNTAGSVTDLCGNVAPPGCFNFVINGPTVAVTPTSPNCAGGTGTITATGSGGTGSGYQYSINGGTTFQASGTFTGLAAGTYTVIVRDGGGCRGQATAVITIPTPVTVNLTPTNPTCAGNNGSIVAAPGGGTPGYTYAWSPSGSGANPTGLGAGTFSVTVTDTRGCTATATTTLTIVGSVTSTFTSSANQCLNGNSFNFTNTGTAAATHGWTFPSGTPGTSAATSPTGVTWAAAGTYTVTHTVTSGACTSTNTIAITVFPRPNGPALTPVHPTCGNNNGAINVTAATGGTPAYQYNLNGGTSTALTNYTNQGPGTYTVNVIDQNGCTNSSTVTLTNVPGPTAIALTPNTAHCTQSDGSITIGAVTGGTSGYTFSFNNPAGPYSATSPITGLAPGTYSVTVRDNNGCIFTTTTTVPNAPGPTGPNASSTAATCGASNGTVTLAPPTTGTGPFTYSFNGGGFSATTNYTGLAANAYNYIVRDNFGCTLNGTVTVNSSSGPTGLALTQTASACGASNGQITIGAVTGGVAAFTYSFNGGPFTATSPITGLAPGTYSVTVRDANGCTFTNTIAVATTAGPTAQVVATTNSTCGNANGVITLGATTGGTAAYQYAIDAGGFTATTTYTVAAGTHTVTVRDANNCTYTVTTTVNNTPGPTAVALTQTPSNCGTANGVINVGTVTGGTAAYQYSINGVAFQPGTSFTGLLPTTYTITVRDNNSCTTTGTIAVTTIAAPTASVSTQTNVTCNGLTNGSASIGASGGAGGFTYTLNTGTSNGTGNFTGLAAGNYTVTVSDAAGCTTTTTFTITQPAVLTGSISAQTNVSCNAGTNGSVTVTQTGGTSPYTYSLNGGAFGASAIFGGLAAGTYTVTVRDTRGCLSNVPVTITQPTPIALVMSSVNANCTASNGTASVVASGGTPGYTYAWTPSGGTAATTIPRPAGNYTVTVTDAAGCIRTGTVAIGTTPGGTASVSSTINVTCNGAANGSITVSMGGGSVAPFSYVWTPSVGAGATVSNLAPGAYSVTITDANGCTATTNTTITQPAALTVNFTSTNVSCNGGSDGTINATAAGGTPSYTYAWTPGAFTTANITGVPVGTYSLTVTDANGCTTTGTRSVTQPTALTITPVITNPHCGLADGSATVTGGGGAGGYTFSLNGGPFGAGSFTSLSANTYTVTVRDANNCTANLPLTLVDQSGPTATITATVHVNCNGGNNGSATVSVTGGVTPYTYAWTPSGQTTQTATNLTAGVYGVVITDASGCNSSASVTITQPPVLQINATGTNPICNGQTNGTGTASAFGGTPPYTFAWASAPPQSGTNATGLGAGTFSVTVTDSKGCTSTTSIGLINPPLLTATINATNLSCFNVCNGTATAVTNNGTSPFAYTWNDPNAQTGITATGLCAGSYTVNITDSRGCTTSANTTITQPTLLTSAIINPVNVTCSGLCNGSGAVSPSGGTAPYSYSWSNAVTTATNTNLCVGSYTSTVTDNNGCITTATLTINTPSPLAISATSTNATCNNVCDGTATSTFSGGTAPYSFIWQPSLSTAFNAAALCDGTHTVTITDANGCTQSATTVVTEPSALIVSVTVNSNSFCGQANGTAQVSVSGGTPNYSYSWSNGGTSAFISGLTSGPYSIIVTDGNNCTANDVATIIDIAGPVLTLTTSTDISCFGLNDGSATVTVNGGTPPFSSQSWLLPGSLSPNPVQPGNGVHTSLWPGINVFQVVDDAGCIASINVPILEPTQVVSAMNGVTNVTCNGLSNGSATMLLNGGTTPYVYQWTDVSAQTTPTATNLAAGTYTCNVTDANGCPISQAVTITEPLPLVIVNNSVVNIDCYGSGNGSINVTPNGGTPAYTYSWSPNAGSGPVVTGLTPGVYQLQVTDSKGCTQNSAYNITQPDSFTVVITPVPSTCSNANASIALNVTGATAPYGYSWNSVPSQTTATASNLSAPGTYNCVITDANGCTKSVSSLVNDLPAPTIDSITVVDVTCNGQFTGQATVYPKPGGSPTFVSYQWTQGATPVGSLATATGLGAGVYNVVVTDANGCVVTGVTTITEPFPLTLSVSPAQTACNGEILGVYASAGGGTPTYTYTWSGAGAGLIGGGNHNVTFTNTTSSPVIQTFSVSVDDQNGCGPVPTQFSVTVLPKITPVAANVQGCEGSVAVMNGAASGGNSGPYTFSWTTTPPVSQSGFTSTAPATVTTAPVTYSLTVDDGCSTPVSIPVVVSPLAVPNASFTSNTTSGCAGFPVTFLGSAGNGFAGSTFSWIFEDGTVTVPTTDSSVVHTFDSSLPQVDTLTVQLVVTTAQGCRDTFTINNFITVYPDPIAEFTFGPETITEFDPIVNFFDQSIMGATYSWNFGELGSTSNTSTLVNPSHMYQDPGYYDVQLNVVSSHGCRDTIVHQIYVEPEFAIYVPNAFSPNDDSRNEVFLPQGIGIDEDRYHLYIYDRWGEIIFESDKLSKGWDGKTKGSDVVVQQDVYVYKIVAYDLKNSKHNLTGHVTVVR